MKLKTTKITNKLFTAYVLGTTSQSVVSFKLEYDLRAPNNDCKI